MCCNCDDIRDIVRYELNRYDALKEGDDVEISFASSIFILVLTGLFFWFAENKKDYMMYVFTGILASIGGVFYLGVESFSILGMYTWGGIIFMLFGVYCFFLSLRYSFMIRK